LVSQHHFGHIRQKVLHGEIDDAAYVQIRSEGEWGDWMTLRECKEEYDGFAEAVGRKIAEDTLGEFKKAFALFDKDGSGEIDASELGTVMKVRFDSRFCSVGALVLLRFARLC
jgi:hypothetical protein